jgi:hypothetical protein
MLAADAEDASEDNFFVAFLAISGHSKTFIFWQHL